MSRIFGKTSDTPSIVASPSRSDLAQGVTAEIEPQCKEIEVCAPRRHLDPVGGKDPAEQDLPDLEPEGEKKCQSGHTEHDAEGSGGEVPPVPAQIGHDRTGPTAAHHEASSGPLIRRPSRSRTTRSPD